jgi:hypothetical protein
MKEININCPFYEGQEVICLVNRSAYGSVLIKGKHYKVLDIIKCECGEWKLDVGHKADFTGTSRCSCKATHGVSNIIWCNARLFAPITSTFQSISLARVLEIETELVGVN